MLRIATKRDSYQPKKLLCTLNDKINAILKSKRLSTSGSYINIAINWHIKRHGRQKLSIHPSRRGLDLKSR